MKNKHKRGIQAIIGWLRLLEAGKIKEARRYHKDHTHWEMFTCDGLCANLSDYNNMFSYKVYTKLRNFTDVVMGEWPEGSGSTTYPVPHPYHIPGHTFRTCKNMFDKRTKYGRARMRLAGYVADRLGKKYL